MRSYATLIVLTAALLGAASVRASTTGGGGCPPISAAQVQSILGLAQSLQQTNTTDKSAESVKVTCNAVAWSGTAPTTPQASLQTAKSGHGAAFGLEAYHPNPAGPDAAQWPKEFDKLVGSWAQGRIEWPGKFTSVGWPSHGFSPTRFGYPAAGIVVSPQGPANGLTAAAACWWNRGNHSAICLLDEEASSRPVVKHLLQFAKIAVPKVLG